MNNQSQYVTSPPDPQNSIDIFKGAWSSIFPEPYAHLTNGQALLFQDAKIEWSIEQIGGVSGKTVLELGPLEAGHTYMMETNGAKSILAIEANSSAYLKCLVVKELFELQRAKFLCGDFSLYLRTCKERFDVCLASGVLYHMRNPVELLATIAPVADQLCIWTHYYDDHILKQRPDFATRVPATGAIDFQDRSYTIYRHEYGAALGFSGFCGGTAHYSYWMQRDDILDCLSRLGYDDIRINFEDPQHVHGPCYSIVAIRTQPKSRPTHIEESKLMEPDIKSRLSGTSSSYARRNLLQKLMSWFYIDN